MGSASPSINLCQNEKAEIYMGDGTGYKNCSWLENTTPKKKGKKCEMEEVKKHCYKSCSRCDSKPSSMPSASPSKNPNAEPSTVPSASPSLIPSDIPSTTLSNIPSFVHSSMPSIKS